MHTYSSNGYQKEMILVKGTYIPCFDKWEVVSVARTKTTTQHWQTIRTVPCEHIFAYSTHLFVTLWICAPVPKSKIARLHHIEGKTMYGTFFSDIYWCLYTLCNNTDRRWGRYPVNTFLHIRPTCLWHCGSAHRFQWVRLHVYNISKG
jgi:hypothetical protein